MFQTMEQRGFTPDPERQAVVRTAIRMETAMITIFRALFPNQGMSVIPALFAIDAYPLR